MAANLGQAFIGAAGIVPTLAQELAAGNFHENRESFHDYIYSKLILGDDKGNTSSASSHNPPVFPNTNLASSYPHALPVVSSLYGHGLLNSGHAIAESGGDSSSVGGGSKSLVKAPGSHKPGSSKKKAQTQPNANLTQPTANLAQQVLPGGGEDLTKVKKKSHHKKKDKTNVCDVCGRGFAEKYTLNRHMLTHTNVKPYSCSKCNMSFSRSDGLAKHMAAGHRRIDAHHCDVCGGTFNSEVSFEQHRREYGNTLPFVCNLCMLAFSQCCHLNYHMKSHALSKVNDSFTSDSMDDKNSTIDVSELIPEDFSPPKKDSMKNSFGGLLLSPSKLGDEDSVRRSLSLSALGVLNPNIVIKPEIEDFQNCHAESSHGQELTPNGPEQRTNLASSSFDALKNIPQATSSPTPSHEATENSAANQTASNLTPSNAGPYLPDTSNSLSLSSTNDVAPLSDSEMKKYLDIKIPNPKFLDNSVLHTPNLSEDGLFRCEICGKGFTRKYHMQRHVKLHIRGPMPKAHLLDWTRRPYACGVCKMGFTRQHHLTRHMLIHTGERPHSCHICGKAFRRFTNLTLHVRTVHGAERPFKCQICCRGFPRLYSLQRHLKLHAKNALRLGSEGFDQLYKGLKSVGMINFGGGKSSYGSLEPGSLQDSPGRESLSSDLSGDSERFDPESSTHEDSMEHLDPGENVSPATQERYTTMQEDSHPSAFQALNDLHKQKDQTVGSASVQAADKLIQPGLNLHQSISSPDSSSRVPKNRIGTSSADMLRQSPVHQVKASNNFSPSPPPSTEPVGAHSQQLARSSTDFNQKSPMLNERFISSMSAQNLRTIDVSGGKNFTDLDIREANFSLSQRGSGSGDGFIIQQQQIQSPHQINSLERPGSRSMVNQSGTSDAYHQSTAGYIPSSSILNQQRVSMDLSATRTTMSSISTRDPGGYSHNQQVEQGGSRNSVGDLLSYSHNLSVNNMPFPGNSQAVFQQQLPPDNQNRMDIHSNQSASPIPVASLNNKMQF